jgi:hypothetical protein
MRKIIPVTGILIIAVIVLGWSRSAKMDIAAAPAAISPHDITLKQGNNLPVDYWAHPF